MWIISLNSNGKLELSSRERICCLRIVGSRSLNSLDRMKSQSELVKHLFEYVCITYPQEFTMWSMLLTIFHMLGPLFIWLRDGAMRNKV